MSCASMAKANTDPCADLAGAKSFAFFARVASGTVVSGRRSFSQVLHRPNSVACFKQIVATGNNQGKMYALLGLRELDRRQFNVELERLKKQSFAVVVLATAEQGKLQTERSSTVLKQIADGGYHDGFEFCRRREVRLD